MSDRQYKLLWKSQHELCMAYAAFLQKEIDRKSRVLRKPIHIKVIRV